MKGVSFSLNRRTASLANFFLSPYLSTRSLKFQGTLSLASMFQTFFLATFLFIIIIVIARTTLQPLNYLKIILISPVIYFMTEALGALGQLIFFSYCPRSYPIHSSPLSSRSLSQFWGRNWNLWVQDWLKDVGRHIKGPQHVRIAGIFIASGLFHEIMVNLPYWLVFRKSYFGTMLAYFIAQALALTLEKRYLRHSHPLLKKTFLYLALFLPSPLFVNVPILTFLGLLP
jgi:hypothetical protein